jgi:hypothetical protein
MILLYRLNYSRILTDRHAHFLLIVSRTYFQVTPYIQYITKSAPLNILKMTGNFRNNIVH